MLPRPRPKNWPTIRVSFRDIASRRAFIRLPPEAKVKLAKRAGAPWSEVNPDADLSEEQKDVLRKRERTGVIEGGTGLGKSMLGGIECGCALMLPFDRASFIGDKFDHVGKEFYYTWRFMRALFKGHPAAFTKLEYIRRKDYHVYVCNTIWGSTFIPLSMDQDAGGSALGEFIHFVGLCEGSQISVRVLDTKILRAADRALQKRPGCSSDVRETGFVRAFTTPDGAEGSARELVERAQRETKGRLERLAYRAAGFIGSFFHLVAKSTMNPQFSTNVMAHRKRTMTPQSYAEVYGGEAAPHAGRVYPLIQSRHVRPFPTPAEMRAMRFGLGIDTGNNYAAVLVGLDPKRRLWALGEHYEAKVGIADKLTGTDEMLCRVFGRMGIEAKTQEETLRIASRMLDILIWDRSSQFKTEISEHFPDVACCDPYRAEGIFDLLPTIDQMLEMLKNDQCLVVDECEDGLTEFNKYIWQQRPSPARKGYFVERKPIDDFNHWLDAWRYVCIPLFQEGPLTETRNALEVAQEFNEENDWQFPHKQLARILRQAEEDGGRWT